MKSVNQLAASWKFDWITAAFTQTKTLTYWFNLDAAFLSPSTLYFILIIIYWRWYRMTLILLRSSILIDVNCLTIMSSSKRFKMESFASLSLVCSLKKYNLGSTMGSWATSSPWQLPSQHYSTSHWHWIRSSKHSTSASFLPLLWFFSMTVSRDVNSRCKQASLSASREAATVAKAKLWQNFYFLDLHFPSLTMSRWIDSYLSPDSTKETMSIPSKNITQAFYNIVNEYAPSNITYWHLLP